MYRTDKSEKDVAYILDNLRLEDLLELKALWGENWHGEATKQVMDTAFYVVLGKEKDTDTPVVMGGIEQLEKDEEGVGCVWFLSTDKIKDHKICILRELKKEIEKADEKFWLLYNVIYKENFFAKKWLAWLGFRFDNPNPAGVNVPKDFEFFYRIRPVDGLGG